MLPMFHPESQQLVDALGVSLTPALRTWLDERVWTRGGGAEFSQALSTAQIVRPEEGTLWAGFMLPDTLPLATNDYGDWLCSRFDTLGNVAEIVLWSHVGGDWLPYGRDWPEALLFDAAAEVLYWRRHEFQVDEGGSNPPHAWAEWSADWLARNGKNVDRFWHRDQRRDSDPLLALQRDGIAVAATEHDLLLRALDAELRAVLVPATAGKLAIAWEPDAVSWLFDTRLIPVPMRDRLAKFSRVAEDELFAQDWQAAERHALRLLSWRQDLGWAYDIAGWAAERRGDIQLAVSRYLGGLRPSVFSDNTIRFRTHWFADGFGKFSAARLNELRKEIPTPHRGDAYLSIYLANDNATLRNRIRDYWLNLADAAAVQGNHARAYACYYNAGWDMGLQEMDDFRGIFRGLITHAESAGWSALAAIARLHQQALPC